MYDVKINNSEKKGVNVKKGEMAVASGLVSRWLKSNKYRRYTVDRYGYLWIFITFFSEPFSHCSELFEKKKKIFTELLFKKINEKFWVALNFCPSSRRAD